MRSSDKPRRVEGVKNDFVLWLKIEIPECWFIGVVYLPPLLDCEASLVGLQNDIRKFEELGSVLLMGDFNARLGELPNVITELE